MTTTAPSTQSEYNAKNIKQLSERERARHRVGMYLGGSGDEGMTVGIREIIDNSQDEALAGHGDTINITFYPDGSGEVEDYGRGLPVDKNAEGVNGIILTVGTIGSGGKYNSENYAASGGLNGVGASAAIATSSMAHVVSYRGGKKHELFFKEGLPGFFANATDPKSKFTASTELRVSADDRPAAIKKENPSGTRIRYWPDHTVFLPDAKFLVDDIRFRMRSTAFLIPNLKINVHDLRDPAKPVHDTYAFSSGLADMVETLTHHPLVTKPVHVQTEGSFTETRSILNSDGALVSGEVERKVTIDAAFAYTNVEDTVLKSYVNIINTKNGGRHEDGLWRALSRVFVNYIKDTRGLLKAKEEPPIIDDVRDGFVGVISISFPEPTFTGQEKSKLDTQQITSVVSQAVDKELKKWIENKKNAAQLKLIAQKIIEASRIRLAAKQQKDIARKRSALEQSAAMPAKLAACSSNDASLIELQLCEGDSAMGGLRNARDARYQAIFPLRGKPLNIYGVNLGKVLENREWADLIQILGAGVGKSFDVTQMRYKRVILLADADPDGGHITSLLLAGFNRYFRALVEDGRLFVAMPPLFSVTTTDKKKDKFFALNQVELDKITKRLDSQKRAYGRIIRHKGLGEYSPEVLASQVMDPETRVLKQITLADLDEVDRVLELTMGNNAADRRDWIVESRSLVSDDELEI